MRSVIASAALLAAVICNEAAADSQPLWKTVAGWDIRVDTTLDNSCFLISVFKDGTVVRVGFNRVDRRGYAVIGNEAWASLEYGKDYLLQVQFDSEPPWDGNGRAVRLGDAIFLWINFDDSNFLNEFMRKQSVVFRYKDRQLAKLSLRGSSLAGDELIRCQQAMNEASASRGRRPNDPFAESRIPAKRDPFSY